MMANLPWLILFVAFYKCVDSRVVSGLYCKDPDTGTLHSINSTWTSKSFCGSYTCRLRKRNVTQTEFQADLKKNDTNNITFQDDTVTQSSVVKETFALPNGKEVIKDDKMYVSVNNVKNSVPETLGSIEKSNQDVSIEENNERYLTEDEIVSISKLLHTVRRSDLDSLIEIYNLAKDIYKEIDEFDPETEERSRCSESNSNCNVPQKSVWHNYTNISNNLENDDMQKSSSNHYPALPIIKGTSQHYSNVQDLNKVPYYYPIPPFQRYSPYLYDPYAQYRDKSPGTYTNPKAVPCNYSDANYNSAQARVPWVNRIIKKPFTVESADKMYGPNLLPYPFSSVYRYNPYPKDIYFDGKMWTQRRLNEMQNQLSYTKAETPREQQLPNSYQMYYPSMIPIYSKESNINSQNEEVNDKDNIRTFNGYEEKIKEMPSWQTEPLPTQVLDEVRANIMEKTSSILGNKIRKSPKLEKIGKLLRLDEILRNKRSIDATNGEIIIKNQVVPEIAHEDHEYEVILDRVLCESSFEPGFFRYGNLTEPYPACCPQKI